MFDTFSSEDLFRGRKWKGNELSGEVLSSIKEEARMFATSQIWKVLKSELQWFAIKSLLEKGESAEDIRIARVFGNIVQEIDKKLLELSK